MPSESSTRVSHSLSETRSIRENEKNVVVDIQNSKTPQGNTDDPQLTDDDIWNLDSANPRNWSSRKKWTAAGIVSLYTFVSPLASSMMAPGLLQVAEQYHVTNPTTLAMTLSIFLLAYALGPLFLAPLSEMYGRTWVLHIANILFLGFNIGCAFSPNAGSLIAFRFLAGLAGSTPIACGGGSISDLFAERDRAGAMAVFTLGPLLGPVIGPIAGGFVAQSIGTKYVFIIIGKSSGLCAFIAAVGIPLLHETYAPVLRQRLARPNDLEILIDVKAPTTREKMHYLWLNISRPGILLTRSFICFILSLYMAFMYGIYYLMFATFANFFKEAYNFSPGIGGLCYLGLGIGFFIATMFGAKIGDQIYASLSAKNGGVGKPEMRVPALIFGSFFVPIGLFWYGWSAQARLHWIMPIIGSGIFGFGKTIETLPIQLYLVDAFSYAASALAAASVLRSLLGFIFPLFGQQMYDALGLGGGNSLLAGLSIILGIPFPIWIWYNGERIRLRSELSKAN
ncbi:MFS general substrate transporter [Pleurotus eryngii]|uniref:MFS general substrate transporter n=1 Tax=Pleurotus eryngii TaxID=5323 RepID=A0A9P6A3Q8_PLEER|nr:MFS general substrate transporter [Pleurotus eryngii]